jgi:hypothetical protein
MGVPLSGNFDAVFISLARAKSPVLTRSGPVCSGPKFLLLNAHSFDSQLHSHKKLQSALFRDFRYIRRRSNNLNY